MIKNIENKKISITYEDKNIILPEEIKEKINIITSMLNYI